MDLSKGITEENRTMVVIPTIIDNRRKSKKISKYIRSILSSKQVGKYIFYNTSETVHVEKNKQKKKMKK